MLIIVFEQPIDAVGPFNDLQAAQNYLKKLGYEKLSDYYWSNKKNLRARIKTLKSPE